MLLRKVGKVEDYEREPDCEGFLSERLGEGTVSCRRI